MVENPRYKRYERPYERRFWNEITPESSELHLPVTAWRHEPKVNKQIQVYAQLHLLQQLMDSLPVCISYVDQNHYYQYANITYQTWFGLKPEEIYGRHIKSVIGPAAYQKARGNIDRALAGETVVYETTLPYKIGGTRYVQGTLVPDYGPEDTVRGYFALIQDLSDRKAAEIALQRKAEREHTLWHITQRIRQTLDLPSILATATEEVQRHLQVDRTLIFQFTSDHSGEIIQVSTQSDCPIPSEVPHWQESDLRLTCQGIYGQGIVKAIPNLQQEQGDLCHRFWMSMEAKSAVIAPILQNQSEETHKLWGFLVVQTCHNYRQWNSGETELLQQVADQLAIAVQQSDLLAQVRHQSDRLTEANRALAKANQRLNALSCLDGLTKVANRRQFDNVLRQEWERLIRSQLPLSLIMFDVDYFKHFNDRYGHPAGDECLITVAQTAKALVNRPTDLVARYGGEEFAVILPVTDLDGALTIAERIRKAIRNLNIVNFETDQETVYVTVSLGAACQVPTARKSPQNLINKADQALYQAKQGGRNQVALADGSP
jgi:diguanylate cyclase (GGDEF)-like protein/PAS domain S-box-containing protein